jgi:hypothetical protein
MGNLNELFSRMSTSVVPAMCNLHATELGVQASSIERLPAGYDYKCQAWVYPERNPRGDIIGLSYRYEDGRKTMAPGLENKRGLVYPFNQGYDRGAGRYAPGSGGIADSYSGPVITQTAPYLRTSCRSLSSSWPHGPWFRSSFCGTMLL